MAQSDYERVTKEVQELYHSFEQLSYPVELLVPNIWKDKIHIKNPLITLQTFGIAKFKGFDFISRFLFQKPLPYLHTAMSLFHLLFVVLQWVIKRFICLVAIMTGLRAIL